MNITAEAVRQLRERTGAGMMECKKALVETKGDLDAAAELMRKQGLAKADKKAARVAAEGVIVLEKSADARTAAMVEVNCETDFVAREQDFRSFAPSGRAQCALAARPGRASRRWRRRSSRTARRVDERRRALVAKIGENISVRRFAVLDLAAISWAPTCTARASARWWPQGRTGPSLAYDLAMHVAASNPALPVAGARCQPRWWPRSARSLPSRRAARASRRRSSPRWSRAGCASRSARSPCRAAVREGSGREHREAAERRQGRGAARSSASRSAPASRRKQDDFVAEVMAQVKGAGPVRH